MRKTKIVMGLLFTFILMPAIVFADGFTNASLKGVYYISELAVETGGDQSCMLGTTTFDGAGNFTANVIESDQTSAGDTASVSGTYSVNSDGTFTITPGSDPAETGRLSWDAKTFIVSILDDTSRHKILVGIKAQPSGFPNNTFFGYYAGSNNTTGEYNTFLGKYAGYTNSTANYNTFIGYGSGQANTGANNTFLGTNAGYYNKEGYGNNFIGVNAGLKNTGGYRNTFQGNNAGSANTTGYGNTYIGTSAGRTNATGNLNVFIGYNAGYYETGSNKLYIDISDTATPLIYGDFAADTVTINGTLTGELVDISSREYKDNIKALKIEDAMETLQGLNPVTFTFKRSPQEQKVGFIAEDVPELVATNDRKGLSSMDVVAVLTKVVQEQQKTISDYRKSLDEQQRINAELRADLNALKQK